MVDITMPGPCFSSVAGDMKFSLQNQSLADFIEMSLTYLVGGVRQYAG